MTEAELKEALEHDAVRRELERDAHTKRINEHLLSVLSRALKVHAEEVLAATRVEGAEERDRQAVSRAEDLARHAAERKANHRLGVASQLLSVVSSIPTEPEAMRRQARAALQMADVLLDEAKR